MNNLKDTPTLILVHRLNELMVKNTGLIYDNNYYLPIKNITIKEIVTKEQFEKMSYKVVEQR